MPFDRDEKRWICSRGPMVNLQRVSSMVKEISMDPCINRSPSKGSKPLKQEKWQSLFDDNGKLSGFRTALKLIILGGIEPSIRAEVWEFLLGCYSSNSTAEYRKQLRMARRERYADLIKECQTMDPSVGTGTLAYAIGSKIMDTRTFLKDNDLEETEMAANHAKKGSYSHVDKNDTDTHFNRTASHSDSSIHDPSYDSPFSDACNCFSESVMDVDESSFSSEHFFDFPPLPVTNLFQKDSPEEKCCQMHRCRSFSEHKPNDSLCTSQSKSNTFFSANTSSHNSNSQTETSNSNIEGQIQGQKKRDLKSDVINRLRTSDVSEEVIMSTPIPNGLNSRIDRASEWRWTLHRIVVDVVRTDVHLEFYEDSRNLARMSDILAVYAWIDPATGYCQGMSDLLSPFVVLYKDNADAFWCFEMFLRRLRENFQMEGPLGIFKQLETLWKILEHTDTEMYTHLSVIGAENLHFAFRMLLVLFRRELSFDEVFSMWEMMWAVDFSEALTKRLEGNCLEPLVLQQFKDPNTENEIGTKHVPSKYNSDEFVKCEDNGAEHHYSYPFCGLSKANFWAKHNQMQISTLSTSSRNIDDGLPVFIVAAILITNRQNIMRNTDSVDDIIKIFNDNLLNINVKRCIRMAVKLQNKHFSKKVYRITLSGSL